MKKRPNAWIREKEYIIEKLRGRKLYGEPVDLEDMDMVIIAAYHLGMAEDIMKYRNSGDETEA